MKPLSFLAGLATLAATLAAGADDNRLADSVDRFVRQQTQALPGRVEISVGPLDPRTQLAPCVAMEPFVPPGNRLWGKTTVGVRCQAPAQWTIYVPVQVRVYGNYVVARRAMGAGQMLAETDLDSREGDLTALPAGVLATPAQGIGKTLKNNVGGGMALRNEMLLAPAVIQQGQDVRLVYKGAGFSASNEGKALNSAADGQVARARTASGQTVSGIARPGGIIEIGP